MEKKTFGKHEKIRKRKEYKAIYEQGERGYSRNFTYITCTNPSGTRRLGITVSRKVGNAVRRNRIKRLLREFFRLNKAQLQEAQDIVIIARRNMPHLGYHDVLKELGGLLAKKADD
ncbi:MAG: ribonuclease P protein component [Smithellaceae bacterium]|nr:ribonuclease P protein component [Smithellaceae bacterium]